MSIDRSALKTMDRTEILQNIIAVMREASTDDLSYQKFQEFIHSFHKYSIFNRFFLFWQMPEGSQFACASEWKKHGRLIGKGQKACCVYAPRMLTKTRTKKDGTLEKYQICTGFVIIPRIFAYEQTVPLDSKAENASLVPQYHVIDIADTGKENMYRELSMRPIESPYKYLNFPVVSRNLPFDEEYRIESHPYSKDDKIVIVNQVLDTGTFNYAVIRGLCYMSYQNRPQKAEETQVSSSKISAILDLATFMVGAYVGMPRGFLRPIDLIHHSNDDVSTAIYIMEEVSGRLKYVDENTTTTSRSSQRFTMI